MQFQSYRTRHDDNNESLKSTEDSLNSKQKYNQEDDYGQKLSRYYRNDDGSSSDIMRSSVFTTNPGNIKNTFVTNKSLINHPSQVYNSNNINTVGNLGVIQQDELGESYLMTDARVLTPVMDNKRSIYTLSNKNTMKSNCQQLLNIPDTQNSNYFYNISFQDRQINNNHNNMDQRYFTETYDVERGKSEFIPNNKKDSDNNLISKDQRLSGFKSPQVDRMSKNTTFIRSNEDHSINQEMSYEEK
ncbi:UNKNOWN [Stylonychia lemnae]|uniref:Uncharacterized protein n=1 Tax=Stylonychia lemnae TaxID=5949 RepID=A0A078A0Y0_STYLE|nr:UNKNOWN [Stylonychia lemnae]|eukprot:CDW74444.1 UNKNOWN [Stylonychia lemnae]